MRIQDPVFKDCYVEMKVHDGYFNMAATVRLKSLLEMYLLGFCIIGIFWSRKYITKRYWDWRQNRILKRIFKNLDGLKEDKRRESK